MLISRKDDNELKLCQEYSSDTDAYLALGWLRDNGIECILDNDVFSRIYPIGFNSIGGLRLMVRGRDLDRALRLLEQLQSPGDDNGNDNVEGE